jgi:hypothetical protein
MKRRGVPASYHYRSSREGRWRTALWSVVVYEALGATVSSRESRPYLWFDKHGKAAARAHDNDLLPCSTDFDEGGAPVTF